MPLPDTPQALRLVFAGLATLLVLVASSCGASASRHDPPIDIADDPTPTSAEMTPELELPSAGSNPTSPPTVTPGGIPAGLDGMIITGALVISDAASFTMHFREPVYGPEDTISCSGYVDGVSRKKARSSHEQQRYNMDRYFFLPSPIDPLGRVSLMVRIMPYEGPGSFTQDSDVFVRPPEKKNPWWKLWSTGTEDIGYLPLPYIEVNSVVYDRLDADSTIEATIAPDGSGTLAFTNIRSSATPSGPGVSGQMSWTCANESGPAARP